MRKDARIAQAKRLRRTMTKPEIWLWAGLKSQHKSGLVFRRQHTVGPYILDFYSVKARLAVEVDGEVHARDQNILRDQIRDAWLADHGIGVHRVVAPDLLMTPDETIAGIIAATTARLIELGIPLPSASQGSQPPSP